MVTLHLEVSQSYLRVSGVKVIVAATHRDEPTSKFYVDADVEGAGKSELPSFLLTSKSTKSEDFFKKCQISIKQPPDNSVVT